MRVKPITTRVSLSPKALKVFRANGGGLIVATEDRVLVRFFDGQTIIANDAQSGACRCTVADRRRYGSLEELLTEEDPDTLTNPPASDLAPGQVYVVLELITLESIAALARAKRSA